MHCGLQQLKSEWKVLGHARRHCISSRPHFVHALLLLVILPKSHDEVLREVKGVKGLPRHVSCLVLELVELTILVKGSDSGCTV